MAGPDGIEQALALTDYRRRVFALYAAVRAADQPSEAWRAWRRGRDELFTGHPQSPLADAARERFRALDYFAYDPLLRVTAEVRGAPADRLLIGVSTGDRLPCTRIGTARFELAGEPRVLDLFWIDEYGGGLFLPFADQTSGIESYGGGRYLLDTVKGADLGGEQGRLVLDFNFAYNPSCAYDPRWSCPLSPPGNRLDARVTAGELAPRG